MYDLQLVDSRLDEIRNTRGELPLEVEDLGDDIIQMETRIKKLMLKSMIYKQKLKIKRVDQNR